jgi:hypothetical protein
MATFFARPIAVAVVFIVQVALAAIGAFGVRAEEPATPVAAPSFSGARAMAHLEAMVAIGPRVSGSEGMTKQRAMIVEHFRAAGATVTPQRFQIRDRKSGKGVAMENIVVVWHPDRQERILLGAHYDTRPFPDRDRDDPRGVFVGANDGASGVALLMELAGAMPGLEGPVGIDFVLFDGEEYVFGPRDPSSSGRRTSRGSTPPGGSRGRRPGATGPDSCSTWSPTPIWPFSRNRRASAGPTPGRWSTRSGTSPGGWG